MKRVNFNDDILIEYIFVTNEKRTEISVGGHVRISKYKHYFHCF